MYCLEALQCKQNTKLTQISAKIRVNAFSQNEKLVIVSTHVQTNLYVIFLQSFVVRRRFRDFATERGRKND